MTFAFKLWGPDGSSWFDSTVQVAGVCVDTVALGNGDSYTQTYPKFAGRQAVVTGLGTYNSYTLDYDLGYPRLTVPSATYSRNLFVFVL